MKQPIVYIVTNKRNGTLYTGVTSNIIKRVYEHKEGVFDGFTKKYGCKMLVFYEL
jgi:putative endonuclease